MRDSESEWDDRKAAANLARHDVSFEDARLVFSDPFAIGREDRRESYDEPRYVRIGMVHGRLLHVAYTMREDRFRIISARVTEPRERRRYHERNS